MSVFKQKAKMNKAAESQVTHSESKSEIPVVYYDGFDEPRRNGYVDEDDDDDLDDSDGFIFDFSAKPSQSAAPADPALKKGQSSYKHNDSWSGEHELNDKNNNDTSMASINQVPEKMEVTVDSVADSLRVAIESSNLSMVQELFEKHKELVDPNYVYPGFYWTPLMLAVSAANLKIAKFLIEQGADPKYTDDSFSVLMCACGSRELKHDQERLADVVKLLVEQDLDVNLPDKFYQTPLIYASRAGNTEVVRLLVKLGADLDAMDDNSWTSLAHAANKGNYTTVVTLLNLGANPLLQTNEYMFPHQLAKSAGFMKVESVLRRFIENDKYEKKFLKNLVKEESLPKATSELVQLELDEDAEKEEEETPKPEEEKPDEDLTKFLSALNLSHLQPFFDAQKFKMKDLLQFSYTDLSQVGITDGPAKKLISDEVRKINLRNWSSASLIALRHDASINCNEAIAVVSNIDRQMTFLGSNLRYIRAQVLSTDNRSLLADSFLNARLLECAQKCLKDVAILELSAKMLADTLNEKVHFISDMPVDHLGKYTLINRFKKSPVKWITLATGVALATIGVSFTVGRLGIFKRSL